MYSNFRVLEARTIAISNEQRTEYIALILLEVVVCYVWHSICAVEGALVPSQTFISRRRKVVAPSNKTLKGTEAYIWTCFFSIEHAS